MLTIGFHNDDGDDDVDDDGYWLEKLAELSKFQDADGAPGAPAFLTLTSCGPRALASQAPSNNLLYSPKHFWKVRNEAVDG